MRRVAVLRMFARDELGQSIIELALAVPLMTFFLVGGADMARAFAAQIAVQNGARAGAESYAVDATPTTAEAQTHAVEEMNRTPGMTTDVSMVTVTKARSDGVTACVSPPTVATPCYVTVRVQMTWRTITQWPFIQNTFNFDRSTIVRVFK